MRVAVGRVLDSLKKEALSNVSRVTSKNSQLIDKHQAKVKLQGAMQPIMQTALMQAVGKHRRMKRKALVDYVLSQPAMTWLTSHIGWAADQIGEDTADMLSGLLGEAFASGESIGDIRDRLAGLVAEDGSNIFSASRADLIAETEVMSAYRVGDIETFRDDEYAGEVRLDPAPDACADCIDFSQDTYTLDEAEGIEGPHGGTWCNCRCLWKAATLPSPTSGGNPYQELAGQE